jgi:hypothetical protein
LECEEDQQGTDGHARVESSGEDVVVLGPPCKVLPPNDMLEDEANLKSGDISEQASKKRTGSFYN